MRSPVQTCHIGDMPLQSGSTLPDVRLAYTTFGTLNADASNAVLVTHGLTSGPDMLSQQSSAGEGAWSDLLRPGGALDADRFFVVCSNVLGSCFGSTNPSSVRHTTGQPWGADFPAITLSDIVEAQRLLLAQLGVQRLRCVVGPSYGGMQALQWALDAPERVDSIGVIVSDLQWPAHMPTSVLEAYFAQDPEWHQGRYTPGQDMLRSMQQLRYDTLVEYGAAQVLQRRYPDSPEQVQAALHAQSHAWAQRFDPHALLTLQRAGAQFDAKAQLARIRCPILFVPASTDQVFPPLASSRALLAQAPSPVEYLVIETPYGHTSSGIEVAQWEPALQRLLQRAHLPH